MAQPSALDGFGDLTRRRFIAVICRGLALGLVGPARAASDSAADIRRMADEDDLAILSLTAISYGVHTDLSVSTLVGAPAGKVVLRDRPYSTAGSPREVFCPPVPRWAERGLAIKGKGTSHSNILPRGWSKRDARLQRERANDGPQQFMIYATVGGGSQ
jgi:hypothetical protein